MFVVPLVVSLFFASPASACGPFYDDPRLSWVGRDMLDSPSGAFGADIDALVETSPSDPIAMPRLVRTREGDARDLSEALGGHPDAERLVERFLAARMANWPASALPSEIPLEFRLYAEGVFTMGREDHPYAESIALFEEILALPAKERQYRSTWAAYMIARLTEKPDDWARVRTLARGGARDSLGLALASYRNEAYTASGAGEPERAIAACLSYRASGGGLPYDCDREDFERWAADLLAAEPKQRARAARDPRVAELVAAWLNSRRETIVWAPSYDFDAKHLVEAREAHSALVARWIETIQATGQSAGADRLAWSAYRTGRFEEARRLAQLAPPMSPVGLWVKAKLAMRAGDLDAAARDLDLASRLFGVEPAFGFTEQPELSCTHHHGAGRSTAIELGLVLVAADRYEEAIAAFTIAGDWVDAAWLAERVLTTDELKRLVDRVTWESPWSPVEPGASGQIYVPSSDIQRMMRHLLARRLAREGRWTEALPYYPWETSEIAQRVRDALARGEDRTLPDVERGRALWEAALDMRRSGWDLLATEMEPDFRTLHGYELAYIQHERVLGSDTGARPFGPTDEELRRLAMHTGPDKRYHYLYAAWDVADRAVALLPEDSDELAVAACTAGTWLSNYDVERSSQMWFVLLRRAHRTAIGRSTEGRYRWWGLGEDGVCAPLPVEAPAPALADWRWWPLGGILLGGVLWRATAR